MGYRSDVRILTTKKGFKELKKFTDNYLKGKKFTYGNLLDDCNIIHENNYAKYFGWDSIKWYDDIEGFEDVTAIVEGLNHLKGKDYSYRFARIGESYDDYEEYSHESNREEEQDLAYPSMIREFDDEYVIGDMEYYNTHESNNSELEV